jgi:hypothetical protein
MPIEATPLEHVEVVAEATKLTGPCRVSPLLGLVTVTPANAADVQRVRRARILELYFDMDIRYFSRWNWFVFFNLAQKFPCAPRGRFGNFLEEVAGGTGPWDHFNSLQTSKMRGTARILLLK